MRTYFTVLPPEAPIDSLDSIAQFSYTSNAHLFVVALNLAFEVPGSIYPGVPFYGGKEEYAAMIEQSKLRASKLEKRFAEKGVSFTAIPMCQPIFSIAEAVCKAALYADLAILPCQNQFSSALYRRIVEGLLFDAGLPTIVLPDKLSKPLSLDKVLIGWYPSAHSARAIRDCLPLVNQSSDIRIAIVDSSVYDYGPVPGDDVASFLARKGLKVTVEQISGNDRGVASGLKQASIDLDTELMVIGAYGHSRMRETLFGGTTKEMLDNPPCALLMSH